MQTRLHVLLVEDCEDDAVLILEELRRGSYAVVHARVDTAVGMHSALSEHPWDMVISDYAMPHFSGAEALSLLQSTGLDLPFIIVSGTIGEDVAVAAMKAGAHDYIMKGSLARLLPAVERELRDAAVRRERRGAAAALRESEELNRAVLSSLSAHIAVLDQLGNVIVVNDAWKAFSAAAAGTVVLPVGIGQSYLDTYRRTALTSSSDSHAVLAGIIGVLEGTNAYFTLEYPCQAPGGVRWFVLYVTPLLGGRGGVVLSHIDVTERRLAAQRTAVLLEVVKHISGTLDLDALLDQVQRRTAEVLPCDAVATFYWDEARDVFRMFSQYGMAPDLAADAAALEFPAGEPFDGRMTRGETVLINDIRAQPWLSAELCAHFKIGALVVAPLIARGRNVGALVTCRTGTHRDFTPGEVELCEGIARHLGLAAEAAALYRSQQDEAQVSGALARVGRALISSLDAPALLERLCEVTAEVLGCDASHTVLWRPEENAYVPIAAYGTSIEESEAARVIRVPRSMMSVLLSRLEHDDVAEAATVPLHFVATVRPHEPAAALYLCMALRRGTDIIGVQTAYRHGRVDPFSAQQRRIAQGIAQMASLVLEHARLVDELGRASRLKSDFVATMSHELRTPLNVIMGYNDLVLEGAFGDLTGEQKEPLRRVAKSATELLELINTTLDVSRLEAGRLPLDLKDFGLADLLAQVRNETQELQAKPGLRFAWNLPARLPRLHTDPTKLKVVLKNLIGNAAKFTEEGSVTVAARSGRGGVEISVADTGIGIPPEAQSLIFEPFRQGDSSATRRYGGVGLGLYIVRRLVEMLGGTIALNSEMGRGSTFRVWIPTNGTRAAGETGRIAVHARQSSR